MKCLQMRPDAPVPSLPPTSVFLGDGLVVDINREAVVAATSVVACTAVPKRSRAGTEPAATGPSDLGTSVITLSPSAPNTPGVLTEILVQRLAGKHRKPVAKAYRTAAFVAFTNEPFELPVEAGVYACAMRFVREATGQETQIVPIGKVQVGMAA